MTNETQNEINKRLAVASDRAKLAEPRKYQVPFHMQHEIRTLMNAVLGMLQLLQHAELAPRQQDYVEKAQCSAKSLMDFLLNTLEFTEIEVGKKALEIGAFSLVDLVDVEPMQQYTQISALPLGITNQNEAAKPKESSGRLNGLHLLVVDDNALNRQIAFELLTNQGAKVSLADNGREGVDSVLAARPQFDAVLMDIQMPVMDGYAATVEIRRECQVQNLVIIATTADASASDKEACIAAGMNDHVAKPIDMDILLDTILLHVDLQRKQAYRGMA